MDSLPIFRICRAGQSMRKPQDPKKPWQIGDRRLVTVERVNRELVDCVKVDTKPRSCIVAKQFGSRFGRPRAILSQPAIHHSEGHAGPHEVGAVFAARHSVVSDSHRSFSQPIDSGWEAGCADRVADDGDSVCTEPVHPISNKPIRKVMAIGDHGVSQVSAQRKGALDDVVVPMHQHGAAIADMGKHRDAVLGGGAQGIEIGIAMTGGDDHALRGEVGTGLEPGVALGC